MSRCCCKKQIEYKPVPVPVPPKGNNCICSLPTLIILILIVLQFSRGSHGCHEDDDESRCCTKDAPIGNGILFIIALFFLSCSGCGRGAY
ncbi:hypothetical protein IAI10_10570 [Clostridium sp. 19966]|uniref:hypothetical protein n=1 Tax=Clostridium sp. 19966 TaxID=2768166 RepID=UPI0028DEA0A1|nr:hypothetical protein [Clostridium sp. 19966]MDT8717101.1 hypothetical protein [Clostridium sp. 19966]